MNDEDCRYSKMGSNSHSVDRLGDDWAELHAMERLHVLYRHFLMVRRWSDVEG